ncbi:MAG: RES family NAD+ phosphorylase [Salinibacterium sp.]|nr:RES family NAD+ phosphorylase [Planctomycetota bacterium]MCB1282233.1 RES family NAD+ phosphorylase [Salinibacterium sp.]
MPGIRFEALDLRPWRMVEAQHHISTLALVDDVQEQAVLEDLLEAVKPPLPSDGGFERLHYLLATPFRYPPLRYGSRFGTRAERGIWYGALEERTSMAEVAYYRLLFLEGSTEDLGIMRTEHSLFQAQVRTDQGIDLCRPPFDRQKSALASPTSHVASQRLGRTLREGGIEAFVYPSARDREGGACLGVFDPRAFARKSPIQRVIPTWRCLARRDEVVFDRLDTIRRRQMVFGRGEFLVRGKLPIMGA